MRTRIDRGVAVNRRAKRHSFTITALAGIVLASAAWAGPWKVGDRVVVKATGSIGTVVGIESHGAVDVQEDKFHGVSIMYDATNVEPAPPGAPLAPGTRPASPVAAPAATATRPVSTVDTGERDPDLPGLIYPHASGMPPPGHYTVDKISGSSLIHVGWLDINGSHYSGVAGGAGGTMTLNARNRIVWHGTITGIDRGAVLHDGVYQAPSALTNYKPVVRIYYTNPNGATEVMDATLEK
jgi:hypothetical protein